MLPWAGGSCLLGPGLTQWKRPRGIRTAVALVAPGGCQATGLRAVPEARGWLWGPAPPAREELPGEDGGLGVELPQSRPQDPQSPRLLAGGHAAPTPAGNGAVAGPCPASARGCVRGAFCRGLSTVWGLRLEAISKLQYREEDTKRSMVVSFSGGDEDQI